MCLNVLRSIGQICDKLIKKTKKEGKETNKKKSSYLLQRKQSYEEVNNYTAVKSVYTIIIM